MSQGLVNLHMDEQKEDNVETPLSRRMNRKLLKVPCNPNACRPLLNRIDLYVTYLTIWEYELVSYIL